MSETFSPDTPQQLLTDLCRLVAERAAAETQVEASLTASKQRVGKEFQEAQQRFDKQYRIDKTAAEEEYATSRRQTAARFESEHAALEQEYAEVRAEVLARFTADEKAAEQALQDAHWRAMEASDAARGNLNVPLNDLLAGLDSRWQELTNIHRQAVDLLYAARALGQLPRRSAHRTAPRRASRPAFLSRRGCRPRSSSPRLPSQSLPRLFQGFRPWLVLIVLLALVSAAVDSRVRLGRLALGRDQCRLHGIVLPRSRAPCSPTSPGGDRRGPISSCGRPCSRPAWDTRRCSRPPRRNASSWTPRSSATTRPKSERPKRPMRPPWRGLSTRKHA